MAILTEGQIIQVLEGQGSEEVDKAVYHEDRLRLHTSPSIRRPDNPAFERFLSDLPASILPDDKYRTFLSLITFPLPTTEVVDTAYGELEKIFDGENPVRDFFFNDPETEQDFNDYRLRLGEPKFWKTAGWEVFKNHINAMIVVDLPVLQSDRNLLEDGGSTPDLPEPYFFVVPTEFVWEVMNNRNGDCEFLFFKVPVTPAQESEDITDICVVLDDLFYRKFHRKSDIWTMVLESEHSLGYTPARNFYSDPLGPSLFLKQNPVSPNLGALDWLLYSTISKRHLDLYAGFPIYSMYKQKCTYISEEGEPCQNGYYQYLIPGGEEAKWRECPKCKGGQQVIGPGTVWLAPPLTDSDDPDMLPGIDVTKGDVESIKTMKEDIDEQKRLFLWNTIGIGAEAANDQAMNEKQIQGGFESRTTVLFDVKSNFEVINKWTLDTLARLRYGEDAYNGSVVSYGTQFFLQTMDTMQDHYSKSKENGAPNYDLQIQRDALNSKRYQNDPAQLQRVAILSALEPLKDYTFEEILKLPPSSTSAEDVALKVNFNDLINRFERENVDIVSFMPNVDFDTKIDLIRAKLDEYLAEMDLGNGEQQAEPAGTGEPGGEG